MTEGNVKVVIGSWGSYNECNERALGSEWLDLSDYSDWEEIAEALRVEVGKRADKYILENGDILSADSIEFDEICRNVWADYCEGRIPDFPESIFDE